MTSIEPVSVAGKETWRWVTVRKRWRPRCSIGPRGKQSPTRSWWPALAHWISFVHRGVQDTSQTYPFLFYGTDWLAFAHLVIAVAFIGPLRDPVRNIWVVEFGMIACVMVIPPALICGPMRGIPFFWRLIDCSFGVFGIIPLYLARRMIRRVAGSPLRIGGCLNRLLELS